MNVNFRVVVMDKEVENGNGHKVECWRDMGDVVNRLRCEYGNWATIEITLHPIKNEDSK